MSKPLTKEENGRIVLWHSALSDSLRMLKSAQKNKLEAEQLSRTGVTETNKNDFFNRLTCQEACEGMAIVSFCKVYNSGKGLSGSAIKNSEKIWSKHLEPLCRKAFPSPGEFERFEELRKQLLGIRNDIVAHSSAIAHEVHHDKNGGITTVNHGKAAWREIDMVFFMHVLECLNQAFLNRNE